MPAFDAIVLGVGGVGSAALAELARRGQRALGLDRFPPGHDRGSSHGQTRIIRRAYFEHPNYVPLVERAYARWWVLADAVGRKLFDPVGLLQVGPPEGPVVQGTLASARHHRLEVETLAAVEVARRFPGFHAPAGMVGLFEPGAGYLKVEECVRAQVEFAVRHGARLHVGETVRGWRAVGAGVEVETDGGVYSAGRLLIAAGAWAGSLLAELGIPLVVRRKPLYWYEPNRPGYRAADGFPTFLFELPQGVFYGFPQIDELGLKAAEHSGGAVVADPLLVSRELDPVDEARVAQFLAEHLPGVGRRRTAHATCLYTLTPDEHFILDRHPAHPQVAFAAGLSGHGFKFTPVLGEILADLALDGRTPLPAEFLTLDRPSLRAR